MIISIAVITYNHEAYVGQTLENILNQNYPGEYEIIIGDDCSTDNTRKILLEYKNKYPNVITLLFNKHNLGLVKNYFNILRHCSGEYIMQCAGDDYWLPNKVAVQTEYIFKYPDYGMFYTKVNTFEQNKQTFSDTMGSTCVSFDELIIGDSIPALSVVFKRDLLLQYLSEINPEDKTWPMEDYPFWLWISKKSKIYFIDTATCVYRIIQNSVSHPDTLIKQSDFRISTNEVRAFFCNCFSVDYNKIEADDNVYRRYLRESLLNSDIYSMKILFKKLEKIKIKDIKYMFFKHSKFLCRCYCKIRNILKA